MADVHSSEQRRANMRAIRPKDTAPEIQIRKLLFARGLRFRLHVRALPGRPDIVLPKHKVVILVHGCFWHGHGCYLFKVPETRREFWVNKIEGNRERDRRTEAQLLAAGWRVLTVWECAVKGSEKRKLDDVINEMERWILNPVHTNRLNIQHR
jgi:DNA mismatch endonuclease, patch repair protein